MVRKILKKTIKLNAAEWMQRSWKSLQNQRWFQISVGWHKTSQSIYLCDFRSIFGENSAYMWINNCVWLISPKIATITLCEKCSSTEFFLVRMFPLSDWIRRDTSYLSVWMRENTDQKISVFGHFSRRFS